MEKLEKEIYNKLKEIRKILEENGGCQHLMMTIYDDGAIRVHNRYWELSKKKQIDIFVEVEE